MWLIRDVVRPLASAGLVALAAACAPVAPVTAPVPAPRLGLPEIPAVRGPLDIQVAYPQPGTPIPRVDSTFIFGSVGSGAAALEINGVRVPVAANGAFLAFLALPADGVWKLEASSHGQTARKSLAYRMPTPPPPPTSTPSGTTTPAPTRPAITTVALAEPLLGTVRGVSDTLATGSGIAPAYPVPSSAVDRRWLFPGGTKLTIVARRGSMLQARLDATESAWLDESEVSLGGAAPPIPPPGPISVRPAAEWVDIRVPVAGTPFLITSTGPTLSVSLYGLPRPLITPLLAGDPLVVGAEWRADTTGATVLDLDLSRPVWGYKAFYETDGTLVLRVRRPPRIDPAFPLRGRRIAIDAGHPPGGAIGPTGLTEAEANLSIVTRLVERLQAAGAVVVPLRTTTAPLVSATSTSAELTARVDRAVEHDAEILVSVHNNAFGEGTNPFVNEGTSTLYFHPQSQALAAALDREIVAVTHGPDLGARFQNIAIGRVTWMPSVITESLFMMFPQQEYALRDPSFQDRLAAAHVRGIEAFLMEFER